MDTIPPNWNITDPIRAHRNLEGIFQHLPYSLHQTFLAFLDEKLPQLPEPDLVLNHIERFLTRSEIPEYWGILFSWRTPLLPDLIQLMGNSPFLADVLCRFPRWMELIHIPLRGTPTTENLVDQLRTQVIEANDDNRALRALREFRLMNLLRIGANDILRNRPLEEIILDLSRVADVAINAAYQRALNLASQRYGAPVTREGKPSQATVLAFGKLGGQEINYSSDIDLMLIYDQEGRTQSKMSLDLVDFYSRVATEMIKYLAAHNENGQAYRVDFRLRPEGHRGPLARSLSSTLDYYDTLGRTWERQALIKIRPVAGDLALGQEFCRAIEPFVYKRFLSFSEINDIKAMKRRIEQKAQKSGTESWEVKTGRGGIRDIEFTIQFLQLLNGGDLITVRQRDTLGAIQALEMAGCLTDTEARGLDDSYRFLRIVEHRLQIQFDLQTHQLPSNQQQLAHFARRMGYPKPMQPRETPESFPRGSGELAPQKHSVLDEPPLKPTSFETRDLLVEPLEQFLLDYHEKTRLNRTILDHLLHQAFTDTSTAEPESDLILEPDPDQQSIQSILSKYHFRDIETAWRNLTLLAQEQRFLSTRRCRHFLASIAPRLLKVLSETPDPDQALNQLERVTASLGGKAVLYELFSFHAPSLKLYVDLCDSPFLAQMLVNNPGMIDELLDSLILNRPRSLSELESEMNELLRGTSGWDTREPIYHSFQDKEILRIAVRDLQAKDTIRQTTAQLSDVAEVILHQVCEQVYQEMVEQYGTPCPAVLIALGKLGGREMSYHSDLDLMLIYAGEGRTTGNHMIDYSQFHTEFVRRWIKRLSQLGPGGKLYEVDMRLRPTGSSGMLVVSQEELKHYYSSGGAQTWERLSFTRARPVWGDLPEWSQLREHCLWGKPFGSQEWADTRHMRTRLESTASPRSLKRAKGGLADVEFLVQSMLIKLGTEQHRWNITNTWEILDLLRQEHILDDSQYQILERGYSFLRRAEAKLRIVTNRPLSEYPDSPQNLEQFSRRLGYPPPASEAFIAELKNHMQGIRLIYNELINSTS